MVGASIISNWADGNHNQNQLITQTCYGVSLGNSESPITAQANYNGAIGEPVSIKLKVRGRAENDAISHRRVENSGGGRYRCLTIEGKLLDENNNLTKQDGIVTLFTTAGEFAGVDQDRDQPGFQVPFKEGKFTAKLRSSIDPQTVKNSGTSLNIVSFVQAQFETNLRTPITTGVVDIRLGARGTDFIKVSANFCRKMATTTRN